MKLSAFKIAKKNTNRKAGSYLFDHLNIFSIFKPQVSAMIWNLIKRFEETDENSSDYIVIIQCKPSGVLAVSPTLEPLIWPQSGMQDGL